MVSKTGTPDPVFIEVVLMKFHELPVNFIVQWLPLNEKYDVLASDYIVELGATYCNFKYYHDDALSYWEMDDAEYILFLLRWV